MCREAFLLAPRPQAFRPRPNPRAQLDFYPASKYGTQYSFALESGRCRDDTRRLQFLSARTGRPFRHPRPTFAEIDLDACQRSGACAPQDPKACKLAPQLWLARIRSAADCEHDNRHSHCESLPAAIGAKFAPYSKPNLAYPASER